MLHKIFFFDFFPQPFKGKPILLLTEEWEAGWIWLIGDSLVTPVLPVLLLFGSVPAGSVSRLNSLQAGL